MMIKLYIFNALIKKIQNTKVKTPKPKKSKISKRSYKEASNEKS
jgi:hypothetical protein